MRLSDRTIAIVGGDEREGEIARLAATTGARVRAYGFPLPPTASASGVELSPSAGDALADADYALFPIPGIASDGSLYAPFAAEQIRPDHVLLGRMRPGGMIILGRADDALRVSAASRGLRISEYEDDVALMLLRGPAIVEGAIAAAVANTGVTIHSAQVGVVGHGTIGRLLARTLVLLGARVHVFARNAAQRADAHAAGAMPHPLIELPDLAPGLSMLFSVVPARVVDQAILAAIPAPALVMDLAAPPGGIDLDAATRLGHRAIWARGLGRRAPVTVGASQWSGISARIAQAEEAAGSARHGG